MPTRPLFKSSPTVNLSGLSPLGMDAATFADNFRCHFAHTLGRDTNCVSRHYHYLGLALSVRDRMMERWSKTRVAITEGKHRQAYYLSLEFLMGRALRNAMLNLGADAAVAGALETLGLELEELEEAEQDAGLGNGGLGRLAACFVDSCATLRLPVTGYGIRYEYGMFRQRINNGEQVEEPDHWLRNGNPWELERPEYTRRVPFGGHTEPFTAENGRVSVRWVNTQDVLAVPYDVPIPGYQNDHINTLRLWKAAATDEFDLNEFNAGDYAGSVSDKNQAEKITMVLYPNDASENGKELRLRQQYFLASASLQDVIAHWAAAQDGSPDFRTFADGNCFQLNDTHPTIAVAELMRLLVDVHRLDWHIAWSITSRCMAYTNHTLLPEALERWPVRLFRQILPRLLEIIFEINAHFLAEISRKWPGDVDRLRRMSIIEEGPEQQIRMAYLAIAGSFSVNGVAELHSRLLQEGLFRDFHDLWPKKFNNKTNGVTPRRWLAACNRELAELITAKIGAGWVSDLQQLSGLAAFADDPEFQARWREVKQLKKTALATHLQRKWDFEADPRAMFDVQVKRIHEYKRQLLNVLHVIHLYDRLKRGDASGWVNRCVLIGGKAAPGYFMAKRIIKLVNNVANVVNTDPDIDGRLKVYFVPNYRVSTMEIIAPGTDLSEQISTAGKEASGTGNMKFMMNGALTIGTLDGANIEIRDAVGADNFFLFGLTAEEVMLRQRAYDPASIIAGDPDLARVFELLDCGHFSHFEGGIFDPVVNSLRSPHDPWLTLADFRGYVDAQREASAAYLDTARWTRMSILNTAMSGRFSTDRTIGEYNRDIWKLNPVTQRG